MRSFFVVARNTLLIEIEYKISYYILIFSNFITLGMEYAIMQHIFIGRDVVGTLSRKDIIPFIILGTLVRSASALWTLVSDAVDSIREGTFQKFLIQPIHFPSYFFAQALGGKVATFGVLAATALVFKFGFGYSDFLSLQVLPEFLVALTVSCVLTWQFYLFIIYLGFWAEQANFMCTAFNISVGIFSGTLIPLDWLPAGLLKVLKFSFFPLIGDFPMRAGLGTLASGEFSHFLMLSAIWIAGMCGLNAVFWKWGTARYEAFGG